MAYDLQPVSSSNITHIGYDPEEKILAVKFKDGALYHYHDCEKDAHEALISAKSIGSHFHTNVRGSYKCSKQ